MGDDERSARRQRAARRRGRDASAQDGSGQDASGQDASGQDAPKKRRRKRKRKARDGAQQQGRELDGPTRHQLRAQLMAGALPREIAEQLVARGFSPEDAARLADDIDDDVQQELEEGGTMGAETAPTGGSPGRAIYNLIIGAVFIIGGMSGELVMKGTESGGALAVVGFVFIGLGIYRFRN